MLIPEVAMNYYSLGTDEEDDDASLVTGTIGGRLQFLGRLKPSLFAQLGIGHLGSFRITNNGFAYKVGAALDITPRPILDIGLHAGLSGLATGGQGTAAGALTIVDLGVHMALVLCVSGKDLVDRR